MNDKAENKAGHAAHTQMEILSRLEGTMARPIRVTIVGAGSFFCSNLVTDLLNISNNCGGKITLVDIDSDRLERITKLIRLIQKELDPKETWTISSTTERTEALPDCDYVINCIEVSGLDCVRHDNDIPAKYGIHQCIGDTIGPGGIMKALRTGPVWLEILADIERLCPQALVLNYTNPMNMLCLSAFRSSKVSVVGLCHSVQGTSKLLAGYAGVPADEMEWACGGINHLAWFTKLRHKGEDLYPRLFEKFRPEVSGEFRNSTEEADQERDLDIVRKDMALHFGAFITESSGHLSEYLPYYRKRPELIEQYGRSGYNGESGFYANNWPEWRAKNDATRDEQLSGETPLKLERSWEYGSYIIEAIEKNAPFRFHGNVYNCNGAGGTLISNLPADGCVEVPVYVDRNGLQPVRFGALPPQMAAVCASNMACFDLAAKAIIEKSYEAATYAMMLDPLTAAVCSPAEIKLMAEELFQAERAFLPGFK